MSSGVSRAWITRPRGRALGERAFALRRAGKAGKEGGGDGETGGGKRLGVWGRETWHSRGGRR